MAFSLSTIGNEQQLSANGAPLVGGKIFTYLAGSSTAAATYTDSTGGTPQANPIILTTLGRPAHPIWLPDGVGYKLVLKDSLDNTLWTIDNITGASSSIPTQDEWVAQGSAPTYISTTQFSVAGDQTSTYTVGRRVRTVNTGGVYFGYISVSAYTSLTTVTVVLDSGTLDSGLSAVSVGLISSPNGSMPWLKASATGLTVTGTLAVTGTTTLSGNAASSLQAVPKQQLDASVSAETAARTAAISAAVLPSTLAPTLLVSGTDQAASAQVAIDFTGIPSWARRVSIVYSGLSVNAASSIMVQIGDSGGIEDTGYLGSSGISAAASAAATAFTTGFGIRTTADGDVIHGVLRITKQTGTTWVADGVGAFSNAAGTISTAGSKTLSAALDRVRITTVGGSATFDAGSVNVIWE